ISDVEVESLRIHLAAIPIQIEKSTPIYLVNRNAGLGHSEWNPDFKQFIIGLKRLTPELFANLKAIVNDLFNTYRQAYGINWVLADLADSQRIRKKVEYVFARYISIKDKETFINALAGDMLTPGTVPDHQRVVHDNNNWPLDIILSFYGLGS